ncbi:MAG: hypothetical protein KatS3mg102_1147 [Planctomycetota bacterium]|nr:MAG: hypothetical protein KatS3mg102_1147 [Planctomycetota bacterium]
MRAEPGELPSETAEPLRPEQRLAELLARARRLEGDGEAAGALELLAAAPAELQRFGSYCYARGALAFRLDRLDEAVRLFEQAVRYAPDIAEYQANLGAALLERARRSEQRAGLMRALVVLEHACALRPRLPHAWVNLGLALQLAGRHQEAIAAFDRALAMAPEDASALYNRAASCHALGREQECLQALEQLLERAPGFAPALRSRCATLARLSRRAEAQQALARYLAACPGAADAEQLRQLVG